ncbi:MAG: YitT family protein [Ruminococcaceae bacterium]|nr:YitT family protein [Oscillospiraceae bacterium]
MNIIGKIKSEVKCIFMMLCAVVISFVSLYVFVIPSNFSPSGVDGISTILYEITNINIGWFKLAINLPLMVIAWIYLKKRYVIYVAMFTLFDSFGVILLDKLDFFTFIPVGLEAGEEVGYRLIASIFSGVSLGICTGLMLKIGCSTGGIDIVACLVNLKKPNFNIERIISIICYIVILCSYFVYWDLTSILLSIIQIFVFEWTAASILRKERYALEVKIVTKNPEVIRDEIINKYQHSATIIKAQGMYSKEDYSMVITVLDNKNMNEFMNEMKKYPDTFIYFLDGVKVQGDFHFGKDIGGRVSAY